MPTEPKELTDARALLERFEKELERPEGIVHLSEALSHLDDIRADSESENVRKLACTLALLYAKKVQARVEPLLQPSAPPISSEAFSHWYNVFQEFENYDFKLPEDIAKTFSDLISINFKKNEYNFMSPAARSKWIEELISG